MTYPSTGDKFTLLKASAIGPITTDLVNSVATLTGTANAASVNAVAAAIAAGADIFLDVATGRGSVSDGGVFLVKQDVGIEIFVRDSESSETSHGYLTGAAFDSLDELINSTATGWPIGGAVRLDLDGLSYTIADPAEEEPDVVTDGGVKLFAQPLPAFYTDRQFHPAADGTTDDTAVYQRIAAKVPTGKTIKIVGSGSRIISDTVDFDQNNLTIEFDSGAEFKQKAGTLTLDTMLNFTGDNLRVIGGKVNGNLVGNNGTYTGRGQLLVASGDNALFDGMEIEGTQDVAYATGIWLKSKHATVRNIVTRNTGLNAIRDWCEHSFYDGVWMYDAYGVSAHGLSKDSGYNGNSFKTVSYKNIYFFSDATTHMEAILVDDDAGQGGVVFWDTVYVDTPNSTGPDCIKVAYVDELRSRNVYLNNGNDGADKSSLRVQQGVKRVVLQGCDFSGGVNFDNTNAVDLHVDSSCQIGREHVIPSCFQQFPGGRITIESGAKLLNYTSSAISITTDIGTNGLATDIGSLIYLGDDGDEPVIQFASFYGVVGGLRVADPMSATDVRTKAANGSWITNSLVQECVFNQGPGQSVLVNTSGTLAYHYLTEDGPPNIAGWKVGMEIKARAPKAGDADFTRVVTTAGTSCMNAYANAESVTVGQRRHANGNVYEVSVAGDCDAGGSGPTGTGSGIADGTAEFDFLAVKAVFKRTAAVES